MGDNLKANLAQIIILIVVMPILLPVLFLVLDGTEIIDILQEFIPTFDIWTDILVEYTTFEMGNLIWIYTEAFFQAIIMGICLHISGAIFSSAKGLPILSTFLGIFVASILIKILGVAQSLQIVLYVVIMLVGIILMLKGVFSSINILPIRTLLLLIIESILAVIMCGYVSALVLYSDGLIDKSKLITVTILAIIALFITFFTTKTKKV